MTPLTRTTLVFAGALACCPLSARAITVPVEPQTENPEFTIDTWTNRYDRYWREAWDGGDNRFRLKFGSNNVREWNLEEELKLAADLLPDRLRLRFWHSRLLWDSSDQRERDTFELELRSVRRLYVSFIGSPTFTKAENAMGLVFQYRTQVDRYLKLVVELPHATRNFAERHGERPGAQYQVFTHQPVRLVADGRGAVTERIWGRLTVDFVPSFETAMEDDDTGQRWAHEEGEAASASGWLEYASGERALTQPAAGVNFLVRSRRKDGSLPRRLEADSLAASRSRIKMPAPDRLPVGEGTEFYKLTEPDSVLDWRDDRAVVEPYVWLPVSQRWVLKSSLRFDRREIDRTSTAGERTVVENTSVVAGAGGQARLGRSQRSVIEAGFAMEYRKRRESCGCSLVSPEVEDTFHDHRLYVAYEYRFSPTRIIRLIETIDLDREDWGSFSIHDHGFVQAVFSF